MTRLKPGDRVEVKLRAGGAVSPYSGDFDEIKIFEIVSLDSHGYYLYIPNYIAIKNTINVDARECRALRIDLRYLGENILYVSDSVIYKVSFVLDGMMCLNCQEFCQYAQSNQEDGSFICYQCRFNPWR
jgi:hypothetical protein